MFRNLFSKSSKCFVKIRILALLTSDLCHDIDHEGYNNVFNIRAETPLGILFKDTSVMETHHLTMSIDIISDENYNIIHALDEKDTKKFWQMMIKFILGTDMARHYDIIKAVKAKIEAGEFNLENEEDRKSAMGLIMKVADISSVARPFEIANKWVDILNNEYLSLIHI